jgi:uncharacterized protein with PhoU and TrkA domain
MTAIKKNDLGGSDSLARLPLELYHDVVNYLQAPTDLFSLSLASRRDYSLVANSTSHWAAHGVGNVRAWAQCAKSLPLLAKSFLPRLIQPFDIKSEQEVELFLDCTRAVDVASKLAQKQAEGGRTNDAVFSLQYAIDYAGMANFDIAPLSPEIKASLSEKMRMNLQEAKHALVRNYTQRLYTLIYSNIQLEKKTGVKMPRLSLALKSAFLKVVKNKVQEADKLLQKGQVNLARKTMIRANACFDAMHLRRPTLSPALSSCLSGPVDTADDV